MLIKIDPSSEEPLFSQIAAAIREQIAAGSATAGTKLPAAKLLASQLDVNLHTVLRAYQELRDQGLVELRRGRGATVTGQAEGLQELTGAVDALIVEARQLGVGVDALVSLVKIRWVA